MTFKEKTTILRVSLVLGMLLVVAYAREAIAGDLSRPFGTPLLSPPYEAVNVALPDFGTGVEGGDYGVANVVPVEVGFDVGRGRQIRIVRTPRELRLSRRGEARFRVLLGDLEQVVFWIESPHVAGAWNATVVAIYPDGFERTLFSQDLLQEGLYFIWAPPRRSMLEFRVTSHERTLRLSKRFIFTVGPEQISFWKDFRSIPYTFERRTSP